MYCAKKTQLVPKNLPKATSAAKILLLQKKTRFVQTAPLIWRIDFYGGLLVHVVSTRQTMKTYKFKAISTKTKK